MFAWPPTAALSFGIDCHSLLMLPGPQGKAYPADPAIVQHLEVFRHPLLVSSWCPSKAKSDLFPLWASDSRLSGRGSYSEPVCLIAAAAVGYAALLSQVFGPRVKASSRGGGWGGASSGRFLQGGFFKLLLQAGRKASSFGGGGRGGGKRRTASRSPCAYIARKAALDIIATLTLTGESNSASLNQA